MEENALYLPTLQKMDIQRLRDTYYRYLKSLDIARSTAVTAMTDGLYLFRHEGHDAFWKAVLSEDFETEARTALLETIAKHSSVDPNTQISAYMSHLRRFRDWALSITTEEQYALMFHWAEQNRANRAERKERAPRRSSVQLPRPSILEVEHYLTRWDGLEDYSAQEEALDKLFFQLCPENTCMEDILLKVSTLNDFYSTHIFRTYPVAKHILNLGIDERLRAGDLTLVPAIQRVTVKDTEHNFYSFATKYCSHHNPLAFPIYDSYVDEVLYRFMKQDHFAKFQRGDLKDYQKFYDILLAFRSFYGLEKYNIKEIDKYLWQLGKDKLPKNYGKKKGAPEEGKMHPPL